MYVLRQLASLVFSLLFVSLIVTAIFSFLPGDSATLFTGLDASPEQLQAVRAELGIDKSIPQRYVLWLKGALGGDFGQSVQYAKSVNELLSARIHITVTLAVISLLITALVSFPLGALAAVASNNKTAVGGIIEKGVRFFITLGLSVPNYFSGIILIWFAGIFLHLFVPGNFVSAGAGYAQFLRFVQSLFFPALALSIPNTCILTKFVYEQIKTEKKAEYVRCAKSKGGNEAHIFFRHIVPNMLSPVLTIAGIICAETLSGSIVIEQVFSIPGMGRLLLGAIKVRDFPVVMTVVLYIAFVLIVVNLIFELLVRIIDPRVKIQ
ncbi:MAG: ABC transporter permease [Treponemataceae bacterium]|nr:MAG: ABC transporter permease [Treponemataceae bacterium]